MYGFAVYRKRGRGTQILKTTAVAASRLPTLGWHGGGDHRDTKQAKISISDTSDDFRREQRDHFFGNYSCVLSELHPSLEKVKVLISQIILYG
ncbi:hypothetical protein C477_08528 [Haloterrigena salina JCM 13891]|uniref:Uncharacterized protein n=1 Tax=Haloterrigena salina JCM 13891 TaxID=1227488 RepID=M0C7Z6_9EURY|nr:hypothetical protein C477_08528 [Haloterrigena salina JCM 13891]